MDKYDQAIEYLNEHPNEIIEAWGDVFKHRAGCLFNFVSTKEDFISKVDIGCLTQIRKDPTRFKALTQELTAQISEDERIPKSPVDIQLTDLPVFVEWQRRLDKELGRE